MQYYRRIKISPMHNIKLIKVSYKIKRRRVFQGFEVDVVKTFAGRKCILMRKMSPGYKHLKRRRACFNLKCKWMGQKYHKNTLSIFYNSSESCQQKFCEQLISKVQILGSLMQTVYMYMQRSSYISIPNDSSEFILMSNNRLKHLESFSPFVQ